MSTFTVHLEVPQGLRDLGYSDEELRREVPILLVLKRFRQRAISSSKAAHVLGISRRDFLELLAREGIPLFDLSPTELQEELKTVANLDRRL